MGLGAVAVAIAALPACRQIVDFREEPAGLSQTGPDASADAGADARVACGLGYGTSRCASCVSAGCCHESSACAANPACAPYASCVGKCVGDPACRAQCAIDSPPGNSGEGPALSACLAAQCESACGLTCGGIINGASYSAVPPDAAAACQTCIVGNGVCEASHACGASPDCEAYLFCNGRCQTEDCKQECGSSHDAGVDLVTAWSMASGGRCASSCLGSGSWACVGHVSWPRPRSAMVTMTIEVKDYVVGSDFSGVDVSICDRKDPECAHPRAHGSTLANGQVVLQFPNPADATSLGLDGYVRLTSPEIAPYLYYWGFPLSEPEYVLVDSFQWKTAIKVLTPAELTTLSNSVGIPYDPAASVVIASALDCDARGAAGVQIKTDPVYPSVQEVYDLDRTKTSTDNTAFAAFGPVPAGNLDLIVTPLALGKPASRVTVNVRPGWITDVTIFPTP
jgi:hypothetical protein